MAETGIEVYHGNGSSDRIARLARQATVDVYSTQDTIGAAEWVATGNPAGMARRLREMMVQAAARIEKRFS
jgi:hypothetical protein